MTYEEVRDRILDGITRYNCVSKDRDPWTESLSLAVDCVEKQIPKKAITEYDWYILNRWKCEECGGKIDSPMGYSVQKYPFCPYCGQAIDWSEE